MEGDKEAKERVSPEPEKNVSASEDTTGSLNKEETSTVRRRGPSVKVSFGMIYTSISNLHNYY